MSSKKETNQVVTLTIVGLILAWIIGGFMGGLMGNIFFGIVMIAVIFSGVFGKKTLEKVGGISVPFAIGTIIATDSWEKWWLYILCYLIAIFIGNALSNFRPGYKQEFLAYENELVHRFTSNRDLFSANFPKKPQTIHTDEHSRQYKTQTSGAVYAVTVYDLVPGAVRTKGQMALELVDATVFFAQQFDIETSDVKQSLEGLFGRPSISTTLTYLDGTMYYFTAFIYNDRRYDVSLSIRAQSDEIFNNFISSFELLDK